METSFLSLDLETTGRSPQHARVVQAALVEFCGVRLFGQAAKYWSVAGRFHTLVDPGVPIPPPATAVHGFSDVDVACAMLTGGMLRQLLARLVDRLVVGYNVVSFDLAVLRAEAERCGLLPAFRNALRTCRVVDVYQWVQAAAPRVRQRPSGLLSLGAQAELRQAGLEHDRRDHDASHDAEKAGWLCLRMLASGEMPDLGAAAAATAGTWGHLLR